MKIKNYLLLIIGICVVGSASSQSSIWKIEGNGNEFYLGGTVHILRSSDYPLPEEYDEVYEKSDLIAFEADLGEMEDEEIANKLVLGSVYNDDRGLKSVLSEKVYQKLSEACAEKNIPLATMDKLKPSMIVLTLTMMNMSNMGIVEEGVDQVYYNKAKSDGKELAFFESVEQQIDWLLGMGEGNEDEFILHSLKDLKDTKESMDELLEDWKNGDNKVMNKTLKQMKKDYPGVYKSLVSDRNTAWMEKLDGFLNDDKVEFVLVGSLHLHGSEGLLNLLEDEGYTVTQYNK